MLTKMRLVIIAVLLWLPGLNAQNLSEKTQKNSAISEYVMNFYWEKPNLRGFYETQFGISMTEVFNNYSQTDKLFVQVHCVCASNQFIGNVYSVSYKDKDHLGKLRFFLANNLSDYPDAIKSNNANVEKLQTQFRTFPNKFNPLLGLMVIGQYGIIGSDKCGNK
jgi:hypothetical protein